MGNNKTIMYRMGILPTILFILFWLLTIFVLFCAIRYPVLAKPIPIICSIMAFFLFSLGLSIRIVLNEDGIRSISAITLNSRIIWIIYKGYLWRWDKCTIEMYLGWPFYGINVRLKDKVNAFYLIVKPYIDNHKQVCKDLYHFANGKAEIDKRVLTYISNLK